MGIWNSFRSLMRKYDEVAAVILGGAFIVAGLASCNPALVAEGAVIGYAGAITCGLWS